MSAQSPVGAETGKHGATCHRSDGRICDGHPVKGSTLCNRHLVSPKARANAAVRAELLTWRTTDTPVDPGTVLLRLLSQSVARADRYARMLEDRWRQTAETDGDLGEVVTYSGTSITGAYSEDIRALVKLESDERDRAARFAKLALDAGIAERQVRLAETHVAAIVRTLELALTSLGLTPSDPKVRAAVNHALLSIEGTIA